MLFRWITLEIIKRAKKTWRIIEWRYILDDNAWEEDPLSSYPYDDEDDILLQRYYK